MRYVLRDGNVVGCDDSQDVFLKKLYTTSFGRLLLGILTKPFVSDIGGTFMNSRYSKCLIKPFVRNNLIDMTQFEDRQFASYNDFFTRRIKEGKRKVDMDKNHLISPCDSKLTVYDINEDCVMSIKDTLYSVNSLLRDKKLAKKYHGGKALVFRLTVDDYHRYIYIDDGLKSRNRTIEGVYHTVNPIANDMMPIYRENHREYTMLRTKNFGDVIHMEVGALMVGRITNHHEATKVSRGEEKGYFEFGGSTIVLLLKKGSAVIDEDILKNSKDGLETKVLMGEKIGVRGAYGKS